ncbi:MAG: SCO1664 family protein, partial [Dehalococcoidia bacterium]|nr:SCO1664 family protein [Dehalococcoidia bacterium]
PSPEEVRRLLVGGEITDCRLVPEGSNYTFLAKVVGEGDSSCQAIYKPQAGERPLWDFPQGTLYLRECASYVVSQAIGWDFIPLTVPREGPHGIGALQQFIEARRGGTYFTLQERHKEQLWKMALFDLFANNADRKAGHCLLDEHDKLWGIDHGLTFNVDPKLRTVIWDFCGQAIPQPLLADLMVLLGRLNTASDLALQLGEMLEGEEVRCLRQRLQAILANPVYPLLNQRYNVPWPLV